jgi:hypothetical protein
VTARRVLLDGLARDADIVEVLSGLAPLYPRNDTFPGEVFLHLAGDALQWCGVGRAEPLPLEGCASGSCPRPPSAGGRTRSFSTRSWPQRPSTAGPNRTCWMRSPSGRPTTSGSTPRTLRSPISAPPPAGRASRCARHARTWTSTLATQRPADYLPPQSTLADWLTVYRWICSVCRTWSVPQPPSGAAATSERGWRRENLAGVSLVSR